MAVLILPFTYHTIDVVAEPEINPKFSSWYDYKLIGRWGYVCDRNTEDCYTEYHRTGASREYPRGSTVEVCRSDNQKICVVVKITDWIEHPERDIDLSSHAFNQLAPLNIGLIKVNITPLNNADTTRTN